MYLVSEKGLSQLHKGDGGRSSRYWSTGGHTFKRKAPFATTSLKKEGWAYFGGWAYFWEIMVHKIYVHASMYVCVCLCL